MHTTSETLLGLADRLRARMVDSFAAQQREP
jgi:hypothetical protein